MATNNRTHPEYIVDKNGKKTTVHRLSEANKKNKKSRLEGLGTRYSRDSDVGEKKVLSFTTAETATLVRETLKDEFHKSYPKVKFSVRSSVYAGGSSIHISYVDGPPEKEVENIGEMYAASIFNGMTDSKEYKSASLTEDGTNVSYGADFIFVKRGVSYEASESAKAELSNMGINVGDAARWVETPDAVRDMYEDGGHYNFETTTDDLIRTIATYRAKVN